MIIIKFNEKLKLRRKIMELENVITNNIEIEKEQNKFFNSFIGKIINTGIDFGLRAILPDIIENQVIEIKNSLIENGLKEGIQTATDKIMDLSKSTKGIFTGKFENISQVQMAIGNGGILDTVSNILDKAVDKTYQLGFINKTANSLIKNGKDVILNSITSNLKKELDNQKDSLDNLENCIERWKEYYNNKNFDGMAKEMEKIDKQLKNIVPLENVIKEARNVETLHNLIKNNGRNFNLTENEIELVKKIS